MNKKNKIKIIELSFKLILLSKLIYYESARYLRVAGYWDTRWEIEAIVDGVEIPPKNGELGYGYFRVRGKGCKELWWTEEWNIVRIYL
jgi:hypothetical protein